MIRVQFDPGNLTDPEQQEWWRSWRERADSATDKAIDAFETWFSGERKEPFKFEFNNLIWKDLKNWLLEHVFYDRCAYCERQISGFYGDAEHYRPKGAVRRKTTSGEFICSECGIANPADGQNLILGHPGYFWLAYDWRNLVPSCSICNSGIGKNDRFEIDKEFVVIVKLDPADVEKMSTLVRPRQSRKWPGYFYLSPAILDERENPLILNPLNAPDERNPHRHLRFGIKGIVTAVDDSPIGKTTIEVFNLRKDKLREARANAQAEFQDKFFDKMRRSDPGTGKSNEVEEFLDAYSRGRYPFSAAALDYYEILCKRWPSAPKR